MSGISFSMMLMTPLMALVVSAFFVPSRSGRI
jgi:hypothetical protein